MKIKVFGDTVPIYKEKDLIATTGWCGYYEPNIKIIKIDSDLVGIEYETTVWHESLEAVWARLSFGLGVDNPLKEVIIDNFSKMLAENFRLVLKKK